ncbi:MULTISPECIES: alpha/beta fold hydrolase [Pseudomonas]|jgi:pimeloyl-ACP methyl ester carboxylesterase|uniref:alpha/beta fold hydrolase n=1 Tax=Pseudomonas TaxID=286 RepID=UPI00054B3AFC|nr:MULTISPECIES: alpha/beta hydrolase [Pseudomonas]MBX4138433.1 alpha/beta hydrolase [Pseudomonas sp. S5F11]MDN6866154.1 alpha/beta hydrolase [Pseudomonas rhodesiae]NMZ19647.1 alpha/beta hydrolase [Pseudomonas rhodesiae]PHN30973.1 alpha/beta hydrolase [Pseudomonas sp. ICMP 564]POA55949.1 alpha/beta hydrolase [Pseudomonas sp. GW531-R1]
MPIAEIPLRAWRKRGQDFDFHGRTIRYWVAGQGEPLLLIHGFPTASWDWHYLWQALAQRYLVIACDMLGFGDSDKPMDHGYCLLEQADLQQALLDHLRVGQPVHVLAHDYGDSVAQELLARHYEGRFRMASGVFLNGGLFPETHRPALVQKLLLSPLGWMIGRAFGRNALSKSFSQIFGPSTRPSESALDDYWSLISCNDGPRILHKLIAYIPQRRRLRDRWVQAMQRGGVPLRVIDGEIDPISGAHMVERYQQLIPNADTVLLANIGHYPQVEAPVQVLKHYLAFRDRVGRPASQVAYS